MAVGQVGPRPDGRRYVPARLGWAGRGQTGFELIDEEADLRSGRKPRHQAYRLLNASTWMGRLLGTVVVKDRSVKRDAAALLGVYPSRLSTIPTIFLDVLGLSPDLRMISITSLLHPFVEREDDF